MKKKIKIIDTGVKSFKLGKNVKIYNSAKFVKKFS